MPEKGDGEVFSNPLPPMQQQTSVEEDDEAGLQPLTNADFRKLMMTPRVPSSSTESAAKPAAKTETEPKSFEKGEERKKKKSYYAKLKKDEDERRKELESKYRDRARERRDGLNKDYEQTELVSTTADYKAVAPDAKAGETLAEHRKQVINESKFLGGDMEHTHLVKGLDYALLDKVRAEICNKEQEDVEMEFMAKEPAAEETEDPAENIHFKTKMGRNVYRMAFRTLPSSRNELFLPHRMAYVVELDDEFAESDIPCTVIRSKADCPNMEANTTLSTNDIVIQKLTQILSYLRQGKRDKKGKKKEKGKLKDEDKLKGADESIYKDLADYAPAQNKSGSNKERSDRDRDRDRGRRDRDHRDRDHHDRDRDRQSRSKWEKSGPEEGKSRSKSYFEKPADEDISEKLPTSAKELVKSINERFASTAKKFAEQDLGPDAGFREPKPKPKTKEDERMKKINTKMAVSSYAECYPGMMESADAIDDSDDEADFTKMDQGNKKGPVGRWDFETQEEYSSYMSQKEALPKAAFQYGVKMADGRKTRRTGTKDEKKELDREWQKIQNIIQKRKGGGGDEAPFAKMPKH